MSPKAELLREIDSLDERTAAHVLDLLRWAMAAARGGETLDGEARAGLTAGEKEVASGDFTEIRTAEELERLLRLA